MPPGGLQQRGLQGGSERAGVHAAARGAQPAGRRLQDPLPVQVQLSLVAVGAAAVGAAASRSSRAERPPLIDRRGWPAAVPLGGLATSKSWSSTVSRSPDFFA